MYSVLGCLTTDEEPCVFPFIYEGKAYNQCTVAGNSLSKATWCPTKIDNNSEYIQGHYGRCKDPNCKQLPGKYLNFNQGCKRPFSPRYIGTYYMIRSLLLQVSSAVNGW